MTARSRRVAVTAPAERGTPGARPRPVPTSAAIEPGVADRARGLRRAQLRRARITLVWSAVLLVGLPLMLWLAPDLARWRGIGLPLGWIAVAWLPYPLLGGLAWWHLRRAEGIERSAELDRPEPAEEP